MTVRDRDCLGEEYNDVGIGSGSASDVYEIKNSQEIKIRDADILQKIENKQDIKLKLRFGQNFSKCQNDYQLLQVPPALLPLLEVC